MENDNHSHVGVTMLLLHQSISRGIHMSRLYSHIFSRVGFPDGKMRPGFADYVRSLVTVMHSHHLAEDHLVFPLLREKLPEAPISLLTAEHLEMRSIMDEIRLKIDRAVDDPSSQESLERIDNLMTQLAGIWRPHIDAEETHFSPEKIDEVLPPDEQDRLLAQIVALGQEHSSPDYLVVPFTLFNLAPEHRIVIAEAMPPVVSRHLVPVAWKEKWKPMMPFLLI
jgi:hypothetical protein